MLPLVIVAGPPDGESIDTDVLPSANGSLNAQSSDGM
jgi:hypothetical protein